MGNHTQHKQRTRTNERTNTSNHYHQRMANWVGSRLTCYYFYFYLPGYQVTNHLPTISLISASIFSSSFKHLFEQLLLKQTTFKVGNHQISRMGGTSPHKFVNHFLLLSYFNTQPLFYLKFKKYPPCQLYFYITTINREIDRPPLVLYDS